MLAHLLSYDAGGGRRAPRWDQVVLWQTAVGLLEWCLYTWLAGFVVFLWDLTKIGRSPGIADKVVRTFLCRLGLGCESCDNRDTHSSETGCQFLSAYFSSDCIHLRILHASAMVHGWE